MSQQISDQVKLLQDAMITEEIHIKQNRSYSLQDIDKVKPRINIINDSITKCYDLQTFATKTLHEHYDDYTDETRKEIIGALITVQKMIALRKEKLIDLSDLKNLADGMDQCFRPFG